MVPIYVVSLKSAKSRRKYVRQQLENAGLKYQIVDAVVGKDLTADEIEQYCDAEALEKHPTWLTPGAIGCALSHWKLYKEIAGGSDEWAVILEDDVLIPSEFRYHLNPIAEQASTDEIIMLYYQSWEPLELCQEDKIMYRDNHGLFLPKDISQPITTGGYMISRSAAARLADRILPIRVSADSWGYFYDSEMISGMRCVYPRILNVAPLKSSIEYFKSPIWNAASKLVDRVQIPILFQWLKSRRAKNLQSRQQVALSKDLPIWHKK